MFFQIQIQKQLQAQELIDKKLYLLKGNNSATKDRRQNNGKGRFLRKHDRCICPPTVGQAFEIEIAVAVALEKFSHR